MSAARASFAMRRSSENSRRAQATRSISSSPAYLPLQTTTRRFVSSTMPGAATAIPAKEPPARHISPRPISATVASVAAVFAPTANISEAATRPFSTMASFTRLPPRSAQSVFTVACLLDFIVQIPLRRTDVSESALLRFVPEHDILSFVFGRVRQGTSFDSGRKDPISSLVSGTAQAGISRNRVAST